MKYMYMVFRRISILYGCLLLFQRFPSQILEYRTAASVSRRPRLLKLLIHLSDTLVILLADFLIMYPTHLHFVFTKFVFLNSLDIALFNYFIHLLYLDYHKIEYIHSIFNKQGITFKCTQHHVNSLYIEHTVYIEYKGFKVRIAVLM